MAASARTQRMFSRSRLRDASRNLRISNPSMPKAFTTRLPPTVSCRIWLRSARRERLFSDDLRIRRPNLLDGPGDQRNQHRRAEGHSPIDHHQDEDECDQGENLPKKLGHPIGKGGAHLLDVADDGRHHPAHRIVLKKADGLLDDLAIGLIPQVGDAGEAHVLNQRAAEIFRDAFDQKQEAAEPPQIPTRRDESAMERTNSGIRRAGAGNLEQLELLNCGLRIQNDVQRGSDREGHQEIGDPITAMSRMPATKKRRMRRRCNAADAESRLFVSPAKPYPCVRSRGRSDGIR